MVSTGWTRNSISKLISNKNIVVRHFYISKPDPSVYKENMEIVGIHVPSD
jgi:hypothetical protein